MSLLSLLSLVPIRYYLNGVVYCMPLGAYTACAAHDCARPSKSRRLCPRHARIARTYFEADTDFTVQWLTEHPACQVCGATSQLTVDHWHGHTCSTGCKSCVRGRLCHGCNVAEGYLAGDPARAQRLAEYMLVTKPANLPSR